MNKKLISRLILVGILGMVFGLYMHQREERYRLGGREAFVQEQTARWERLYNRPHYIPVSLIAGIIGVGLFVGVYELCAAGADALMRGLGPTRNKS